MGERSTRRAGGRAGGARTHKRLERARARVRAGPAGGGGTGGTLEGGGTGEPPSSPSRPERETLETAADWLAMVQVVGARETRRLLFPHFNDSTPHFPLLAAVIPRARAHNTDVVQSRMGSAPRELQWGGAKLEARARLTVVVLRLSLQLFDSSRPPSPSNSSGLFTILD